jgi:hypothetical protein
MTVTADQITAADTVLDNVAAAAEVADEIGITFYQLCALLEKESHGRNVYGGDVGGTFERFRDPVTECNWRGFRHEVITLGKRSNGVGPAQLTYKGFFADMEAKGLKPWVPKDNILYGAGLYWSYFVACRAEGWSMKSSIRRAGTKYNTGEYGFAAYGDRLFELTVKWRELVGIADTVKEAS